MGPYVARNLLKLLADQEVPLEQFRVGILGLTFKENIPDIRNSKVIDVYRELQGFGIEPLVHDPLAEPDLAHAGYAVRLAGLDEFRDLNALILTVPHRQYDQIDAAALSAMIAPNGVFVDVKSRIVPGSLRRDIRYWSL